MATVATSVRALTGPDVLDRLGPALDELLEEAGCPVTARRPWLSAWVRCHDLRPVALVVDGPDGSLRAAALLALRPGRPTRVLAMGHGPSDYARLPARDRAAAEDLAHGLASWLGSIGGPWALRIEQLPAGDPVALAASRLLPLGRVEAGDGAPAVRFGPARSLRPDQERRVARKARRASNRLRTAGLTPEVSLTRDPIEIEAWLPEVLRVRAERDRQLVRRTDRRDRTACFFRDVLATLARRGEVELATLHLDGRLAAYLVSFLDGDAYRIWDTRFDPRFAAFSPGHLLDRAVMQRVVADERIAVFDHMRGEEPHKFLTATEVVPARRLVAWSSPAAWAVDEAPRASLDLLRRARDRSPAARRVWLAVKRRFLL